MNNKITFEFSDIKNGCFSEGYIQIMINDSLAEIDENDQAAIELAGRKGGKRVKRLPKTAKKRGDA